VKQEIAVIPKTLPVEIGALPPRPVWDEHLDAYQERVAGYKCESAEDFRRGKELSQDGVRLKKQVFDSYEPLVDAIKAILNPVYESRSKATIAIENSVRIVDATYTAWKREQDRLAQEKADAERRERDRQREEARQAEIKRQEELRAQQAATAAEYGEEDELPRPVVIPEIIPSRPVTIKSEFTGRKGLRTKPKPVAKIVDPDKVERRYCSPDMVRINAEVKSSLALFSNPSLRDIQAIEIKVGGIVISFE